jgi:hypothetical protein
MDPKLLSTSNPLLGIGDPIPVGGLPNGWAASYYVLCTPSIAVSPDTSDFLFQYNTSLSGVYKASDVLADDPTIQTVSDFAMAVRDGRLQANTSQPFLLGSRPMEFSICQNCYIVMSLDEINWQFSKSEYAITIQRGTAGIYADLYEVPAVGNPVLIDPNTKFPVIGAGCTVAYFSAYVKSGQINGQHSFNLHVQFTQGNQTLSVKIDPDIQNNGTQPPPWPPLMFK